jgi:hypothetical protein
MAGAFFVERGVFMYPVSEAFLRAVQFIRSGMRIL